ncbi:Histone H2A-Bbd type 2/3 [Lemmus lemmus]
MPRNRQSSRQGSSSGQDSSGQGSSRQGPSRQGSSRRGSSNQGSSRQGSSRQGSSRRGRSSRAGLILLVSLVDQLLWETSQARRQTERTPILLTAILEFLIHRLLQLARSEAQNRGAEILMTLELLNITVYNNTLLRELFQSTTISQVAPPEPGRHRRSSRRSQ